MDEQFNIVVPICSSKKIYILARNQLLTAEITIKSIKYLLANEALNMQSNSQYFSTSFDGELGLQKDVFKDFLEHPNGCRKYFLHQQLLPQETSQQLSQQ